MNIEIGIEMELIMYKFIEINNKEFVKEMYDTHALCMWGDDTEFFFNKAYSFFKENHYLKEDDINFYRISSDLIREVYPVYGTGGVQSWVVILPTELNLDLNNDDEYINVLLEGHFKIFNEMIDAMIHKDDPEFEKQRWIELTRKMYKTVDSWIEKVISAYSYHEPISEDKVQIIKNCKTWEDVYNAEETVVKYLPR